MAPSYMRDASLVAGNAPDEVKTILANPMEVLKMYKDGELTGFGRTVLSTLTVTEASLVKKAEEPMRDEARVVCKLIVDEEMLNGANTLHGGCSAFLVDICSTLPIIVYGMMNSDKFLMSVSQSINMTYHSPALLGDELKIVNTTMTVGTKSMIWNVTRKRLVASGIHVKMEPSQP
ncbi:hypothetical protein BDZ89DRAFT_983268, partial [Hymenopellis radicata]